MNKRWAKSRKFRITAGQSVYLLVLDKKSKGNMNYTTMDSAAAVTDATPTFHYVTAYGSRISQDQVLFTQSMATAKDRMKVAESMTNAHLQWKIQAHKH
jgi:hypothetical protein